MAARLALAGLADYAGGDASARPNRRRRAHRPGHRPDGCPLHRWRRQLRGRGVGRRGRRGHRHHDSGPAGYAAARSRPLAGHGGDGRGHRRGDRLRADGGRRAWPRFSPGATAGRPGHRHPGQRHRPADRAGRADGGGARLATAAHRHRHRGHHDGADAGAHCRRRHRPAHAPLAAGAGPGRRRRHPHRQPGVAGAARRGLQRHYRWPATADGLPDRRPVVLFDPLCPAVRHRRAHRRGVGRGGGRLAGQPGAPSHQPGRLCPL